MKQFKPLFLLLLIAFLLFNSCTSKEEECITGIDLKMEQALYKDSLFQEMEQVVLDKTESDNSVVCFFGCLNVFCPIKIELNSNGEILVDGELKKQIIPEILEFYFWNKKNHALKSNYPFYSLLTKEEIIDNISKEGKEIHRIESLQDYPEEILKYHYDVKKEWENKFTFFKTLGVNTQKVLYSEATVEIDYDKNITGHSRIRDSVIWAYYELRNIESLRYFKVSYLDVYMKYKKTKSEKFKNALDALEFLFPINVIDRPNCRRKSGTIELVVLPNEL